MVLAIVNGGDNGFMLVIGWWFGAQIDFCVGMRKAYRGSTGLGSDGIRPAVRPAKLYERRAQIIWAADGLASC